MGRSKSPLELIWNHFRVGNCPLIGLGHLVLFIAEVKKKSISILLRPFSAVMACSTFKLIFSQLEE